MAFLQGLQIGANIGNMRVAQQERMMQLRSQAALNAIHERQLAAQADMLAQHAQLYRAQIDKMEDAQKQKTADLAAANDLYHYHTEVGGLDPDEASRNVIGAMTFKNPDLAKEMAGTYETVQKAKTSGMPKPLDQSQIDLNKAREDASKSQAELNRSRAASLENNSQIEPQVRMIEGKKFLVNPKTGAVHEISKNVSKKAFIDKHIGEWMRNNIGMSSDEAAKSVSDFYDKYLKEESENTTQSTGASTNEWKQVGNFKFRVK